MNTAAVVSQPIPLPPLPFDQGALAPVISANTLNFHYGKHHKTYVETLNKLIVGTEFADMPLEKIIGATSGHVDQAAIFNNAAQAWNHTFYWKSLKPKGGGEPPAALKRLMETSFGGVDQCKKELSKAAVGQFGSGWAWLVQDGEKLKILKTPDAQTPAHDRRLGARLLFGLPEPARGLRQCADRQARELGIRGRQSRVVPWHCEFERPEWLSGGLCGALKFAVPEDESNSGVGRRVMLIGLLLVRGVRRVKAL